MRQKAYIMWWKWDQGERQGSSGSQLCSHPTPGLRNKIRGGESHHYGPDEWTLKNAKVAHFVKLKLHTNGLWKEGHPDSPLCLCKSQNESPLSKVPSCIWAEEALLLPGLGIQSRRSM